MAIAHLGSGWSFPVEPDRNGALSYQHDEAKIQQSILIILGTAQGERMMRPEFGSRLRDLVFAPLSSSTKSLVAKAITDALIKWEPRVDLLSVRSDDKLSDPATLVVNIEYRVRATNSVFNLVYPFYLREGNNAAAQTL
ncbi:GPW/gp25 family protein [Bradyrhizobium sp. HKCCYLS20291]|uniref:GPW/gp25 family protein n=1 Tax=Bradyrhizobium sp. HKCCYLS20291 TaxID=3420766 RepID=UPI003EB7CCAC